MLYLSLYSEYYFIIIYASHIIGLHHSVHFFIHHSSWFRASQEASWDWKVETLTYRTKAKVAILPTFRLLYYSFWPVLYWRHVSLLNYYYSSTDIMFKQVICSITNHFQNIFNIVAIIMSSNSEHCEEFLCDLGLYDWNGLWRIGSLFTFMWL